jgi:1-acyl-sn-glycerol-3-phosphate acyltransferase
MTYGISFFDAVNFPAFVLLFTSVLPLVFRVRLYILTRLPNLTLVRPLKTPAEICQMPLHVGNELDRSNNPFARGLAKLMLRLLGWKIAGTLPDNTPRLVVTAAPHTSNFDGFYFFLAITAMGLNVRVMAKHSLFKGLFGSFLRYMGAFAVDRRSAKDVVQQVADQFASKEKMLLVLAPEGTREAVEKWKTGFVRMAHAASVPISLGFMDYKEKVVGMGPIITASGDHEADLRVIQAFYSQVTPKAPENFICK